QFRHLEAVRTGLAEFDLELLGDHGVEVAAAEVNGPAEGQVAPVGDGDLGAAGADVEVERRVVPVFIAPVDGVEGAEGGGELDVHPDGVEAGVLEAAHEALDGVAAGGHADDLGLAEASDLADLEVTEDEGGRVAPELRGDGAADKGSDAGAGLGL